MRGFLRRFEMPGLSVFFLLMNHFKAHGGTGAVAYDFIKITTGYFAAKVFMVFLFFTSEFQHVGKNQNFPSRDRKALKSLQSLFKGSGAGIVSVINHGNSAANRFF